MSTQRNTADVVGHVGCGSPLEGRHMNEARIVRGFDNDFEDENRGVPIYTTHHSDQYVSWLEDKLRAALKSGAQPPQADNNARAEIFRLLKVAKSDCKQHNWEKLLLVLDRIGEKLSPVA